MNNRDFLTIVFTDLVTNNAAAVLVFPIAVASAESLDANLMPFAVAIAVAASAGFATPFGYQTNLMVFGPGGYRFSDFLKVGIFMNIFVGLITTTIVFYVFF